MSDDGFNARIDALLADMTLTEKLGQLNMVSSDLTVTGPGKRGLPLADISAGRVGSVLNWWGAEETRAVQRRAVEDTRLGIPLFFGFDIVHGQRTIFPIPLAEACAFDPVLWEQTARVAAAEGAEDGLHITFAPMLDVARDPRWGRIAETPGEDPFVGAQFARAKVRGFQNGSPCAIAATAKHFVAYGLVNAGREYAQVDVSDRALHEVYLPPFHAAVSEGIAAIMPAFSDIAGLPMHANRKLLTEVVRDRWGFKGIYISDYAGIADLVSHGVAADLAEAAALAMLAGIDIDMMGFAYLKGLPAALERGLVNMTQIDVSVRRVLAFKFGLGLFDDPYRACNVGRPNTQRKRDRRFLALESARRSTVLLKNDNHVLPMTDSTGSLAIIGPLADAHHDMLGPWSALGEADETISIVDRLRLHWPHGRIMHVAGARLDSGDDGSIRAASVVAHACDISVLCLGESRHMSGEAGSRADPSLPAAQIRLARAVIDAGRPVVLVLCCGRPLVLPDWLVDGVDAVVVAWFGGSETGHAIADILTGSFNPSARLAVTWPAQVGQIPIWYGMRPTGRPADPNELYSSKYLDSPVEPRFVFGEGMSFTSFTIGEPVLDRPELRVGECLGVSVDVANTGSMRGRSTIFLFLHDAVASISRPMLELKAFRQIELGPESARKCASS